jgi:signal transduction histidine kinase
MRFWSVSRGAEGDRPRWDFGVRVFDGAVSAFLPAMAMAEGGGSLADLLEARADEIARRFVGRAVEAGAAKPLPASEIMDSLREYVIDLARALRGEPSTRTDELHHTKIAGVHGRQRFRLGYDVGALVREYAALRELLFDVLEESSIKPDLGEVRTLFGYVTSDIADAAVEYGAARDAEIRRRTSQHLAFLAHELRNPLASARMALSIMRDRNEVQPSRALDALERGLTRAGTLIDDSLMKARLSELATLECSNVAAGDLLRDVAQDSEVDAAAKGVVVHVAGAANVQADERALRSALSNLVRNAVKFTRAGGHVHVRARRADGRVVIEIEDECGGLPEGAAKKLFDPFVQVGNDRSGFGIGLAIAKQAADAHGGELRVHDLPGKGCVFVLELPESPSPPDR